MSELKLNYIKAKLPHLTYEELKVVISKANSLLLDQMRKAIGAKGNQCDVVIMDDVTAPTTEAQREYAKSYYLDNVEPKILSECSYTEPAPQQEKDKTMYPTLENQQLEYFVDRLGTIKYAKRETLEKQFGQSNDPSPQTGKEVVDRILAGKYILADEEASRYRDRLDQIIWRDPSIKRDDEGYAAAWAKLFAAYETARDAVYTAPANGATIVQTFETWTLS